MGLVRCPVCSEQSWAVETVSLLNGKRRLGQDLRISTDISVWYVLRVIDLRGGVGGKEETGSSSSAVVVAVRSGLFDVFGLRE